MDLLALASASGHLPQSSIASDELKTEIDQAVQATRAALEEHLAELRTSMHTLSTWSTEVGMHLRTLQTQMSALQEQERTPNADQPQGARAGARTRCRHIGHTAHSARTRGSAEIRNESADTGDRELWQNASLPPSINWASVRLTRMLHVRLGTRARPSPAGGSALLHRGNSPPRLKGKRQQKTVQRKTANSKWFTRALRGQNCPRSARYEDPGNLPPSPPMEINRISGRKERHNYKFPLLREWQKEHEMRVYW